MLRRPRLNLLALLLLLLATPSWLAASPVTTSYKTQVQRDLDGDHVPDTVTLRQSGFVYKIHIQFSSGKPKLHLTFHHAQDEVGLAFQTSDVDNDRDEDLIITSATSLQPIAVWLNYGKAKFLPASRWKYGGPDNRTGPGIRRRTAHRPELPLNSSSILLPQAIPTGDQAVPDLDPGNFTSAKQDQLPSTFILNQVPARGPPASPRIHILASESKQHHVLMRRQYARYHRRPERARRFREQRYCSRRLRIAISWIFVDNSLD